MDNVLYMSTRMPKKKQQTDTRSLRGVRHLL